MNRYDIVFSKSSNHGATWTAPIEVSGQPWGDKPWIGVSPSGVDVYIAYATSSDVWIAASHNSGASFAPAVKLNNDNNRYRYPNGLEVLANGTAVMSASNYPGSNQQSSGPIDIETWRTTNGGTSWTRTVLAAGVQRGQVRDLVDDGARQRRGRHARGAVHGRDGARTATATCGRAGRPMAGVTWAPADRAREQGQRTRASRRSREGRAGVFRIHYARQPHRLVEHVLPLVDGRRSLVERRDRHLRRRYGRDIQERRRVHLGVRRLRRDRHHEHRQDRRGLGRGRELLDRARRHLVQPADGRPRRRRSEVERRNLGQGGGLGRPDVRRLAHDREAEDRTIVTSAGISRS